MFKIHRFRYVPVTITWKGNIFFTVGGAKQAIRGYHGWYFETKGRLIDQDKL